MKSIFLLRHAKSSWDDPSRSDHERSLNQRGRRAARQMGEFAAEKNIVPERIICSTAVRTQETAEIFLTASGIEVEMFSTDRVYEASAGELFDLLAESDDMANSVLLIGHNPGIADLVYRLTGNVETVPTATLISISTDAKNWSDLVPDCGQLEGIYRPKELAENSKTQ